MVKDKILVVDDEETIRYALTRLLKPLDVEVVTAADGELGLAAFEEHSPDLVLLDIMMPKMNGLELCERLKSNRATRLVPVVIVTSSSEPKNKIRGIEVGADDFISKPFDRAELTARVRSLLRIKHYTDELEQAETVLFALAAAIEGKDPYTEGHCERLSIYAQKLARKLGFSEDEVKALRRAGIVHDVGKVAVSEAILLKPGPLTDGEYEIMRRHPVVGEGICRTMRSFRDVIPIIRHHHERMDGTGYPDGLVGEAIPRTARVLTVVDVFDALTTERPYRAALDPKKALEIMTSEVRKGWWDPKIFQAFREIVEAEGFELVDQDETPEDREAADDADQVDAVTEALFS